MCVLNIFSDCFDPAIHFEVLSACGATDPVVGSGAWLGLLCGELPGV
jgi:hypothetical protein